jgi:putative flippase GtrA
MTYLLGGAILVGIVMSYAVNRIFTARIYARRTGRALARQTSLALVGGLWADGLVLLVALILFSAHWLLVIVPWMLANYIVAMLVVARRRSEKG